ncbi:MAG: reverse transcriptase domain-containing protein [Methanosarcina mazei]|nr:reverse transcriptase domain-containing protein [Methanosarcina mazei]
MENIVSAYENAKRGKTHYQDVTKIEKDREVYLRRVRDMLISHSYRSSEYRTFTICENGKERLVADIPFYPDRIIHWAVMQVIETIILNNLIDQTYAAIPGRGAHQALTKLDSYLKDEKVTYCLKTDVRKFFPSIDKNILKSKLRTKIKDRDVLWLLNSIIDQYPLPGIPIGNYTSQYFANFYLSEIDHIMKERYKCHYYLRYMDDIIILGYSKQWLHKMQFILDTEFQLIGLTMKCNWQIFPIEARGIDFLGYRTFKEFRLLRKNTKRRLKRTVSEVLADIKLSGGLNTHNRGRIASYNGVLSWCDSYRLRERTIGLIEKALEKNDKKIEKVT